MKIWCSMLKFNPHILQGRWKALRVIVPTKGLHNKKFWCQPHSKKYQLTNTLFPKSFCSLEHFALQLLCIPTHFTPCHTLLLSTLYFSAHFNPQHTLIIGVLFFLEHITPWNTLLPGTLCFLSVPGSKGCWGGQFTN